MILNGAGGKNKQLMDKINRYYTQILTKKEDSYKKGIEENLIRELQLYIKKTLKLDKVYYICPDSDGALRSVFMKLGVKKSPNIWYENEI